jgi:protein N-terminal methyltransferase
VEPIARFTDAIRQKSGVGTVFNVGLEAWDPPLGTRYDLIWVQWCVGHLTDDQLVGFLKVCQSVLTPGTGVIVVKENQSTSGKDVFDPEDSSVTR